MDAPPIQYARTADGVNIAYIDLRTGLPIVFLGLPPFTDVATVFSFGPKLVGTLERFFGDMRWIMLNSRGTGSSSRDAPDWSMEGYLRDIEAVVSAVGIERFVLQGAGLSGPPAIAYAERHPEQVAGLILHDAWASGEWLSTASGGSLLALADADPETFAKTFAHILTGWREGESLPAVVEMIREAATDQAAFARSMDALRQLDATPLLGSVAVPTLVSWERGGSDLLDGSQARAQAESIRDAQLLITEVDEEGWPVDALYEGRLSFLKRVLRLADDEAEPAAPQVGGAGGLRAILFTDLESSTALAERVGDEGALTVIRGHMEVVRAALEAHGGEEVKNRGDGIMAAFRSAVAAVEAALSIQRDSAGAEVRVRVGLNAGEPIEQDGDYFGTMVNLAARVCDRAEPGQVLVPQVVRDLCRGKTFTFDDQGETTLKGFPEPVRLFVVQEGAT